MRRRSLAAVAFLPVCLLLSARASSAVGPEADGAAVDLAALLRAADSRETGGIASVLVEAGPGRLEGRGFAVTLGSDYHGRLRVDDATVVVEPTADGKPCRFELRGLPFGSGSFVLKGSVEWGKGPAGGDRIDATWKLDDVSVEALRAAFPERFDPSFSGLVDAEGTLAGVLGETTTEDVPATPAKGQFAATIDWTALGRSAPMALRGSYSVDDRMVRLRDSTLAWSGFSLPLTGWVDPRSYGAFNLTARFEGIDTAKVAAEWGVAPEWRPAATLAGKLLFEGKQPGKSILSFEASAPSIAVPAWGGWGVVSGSTKLRGQALVSNADISSSTSPTSFSIGGYELGPIPGGLRWWRDELTATVVGPSLWGGELAVSTAYKPADGPAFLVHGRLVDADAAAAAAALAPWLGLDVEGSGSVSFVTGQDAARSGRRDLRLSLRSGRLGGDSLVAQFLAALAAADGSLALADAASVIPVPRKGTGTRVDRLHFEASRRDDGYDLGRFYLRSGEFQLDADGRFDAGGNVELRGAVMVPDAVADAMTATAPWLKALRAGGELMFVPVVVSGPARAPRIALAPEYAALLARARRGEAVEAPRHYEPRHVGGDDVGPIPGDPSRPEF